MPAELVPDTPEQLTIDSFEPINLELWFDRFSDVYSVVVQTRDATGRVGRHSYVNAQAKGLISTLNTADLSVKSLRQRVLEKLRADGKLPPGTVNDDGADLQ